MARLLEMEEYKGLSETELQEIAYDETIAEMSETILTDTDAANRLSQQIYKQDRTLWQKIKDFFAGLVEKLRSAYKGSDPDSDIGRMLKRAVQDNAEIAQAWAEAVSEAGENYQMQDGQKNNAREGVRFSLREYDAAAKAFSDEISEWDESGRDGSSRFILGSTGEVLQGLGAIESDIYMNGSKINTILQDHPEITLREIKRIPEILNDPVLILKSRNVGRGNSQNTRMTIFGTVKGQNGLPVMTVFDLRPSENHFVIDDMQKVTSAYTKTNSATSFVSNSFVLYADKKRTTSLLRTIGFQMPIELLQSGYVGNITYNKQNVNIYGEKFSDVVGAENAVRYSSRNQQDSEYMELAKEPEENQIELEAMVQTAANENGFHYRRQTNRRYSPQRDGHIIMFVDGVDSNVSNYGDYVYYATDKGAIRVENILPELRDLAEEFYGDTVSDEEINPPDIVMSAGVWDDQEFVQYAWDQYFEAISDNAGVSPALATEDGLLMFDRDDKRIKSGAAIEYDDSGNVIPLSQRFNADNADIRFSDRNSQSRQVERLEKKNAELKAEAEYLKQVVKVQKSGNKAHILDRSSVNAIGKGLMESVNAKGSEFGKLLNDFYRALGTEDMSYETMQDRAGELAALNTK